MPAAAARRYREFTLNGGFMERLYGKSTWAAHEASHARILVIAGAVIVAAVSFFLLR